MQRQEQEQRIQQLAAWTMEMEQQQLERKK